MPKDNEKTPQEIMGEKMSHRGRERGGRPVKATRAHLAELRKGSKREKRDALRGQIGISEPSNKVAGHLGRLRRMRRDK